MGLGKDGNFYILDIRRVRESPHGVQELIRHTADMDGREVPIVMEEEPGAAGKAIVSHYLRDVLQGFDFRGEKPTGAKGERAQPLAAKAEPGLVKLVRGTWVKDWLDEVELFPFDAHDDMVDATSMALKTLVQHRQLVPEPELQAAKQTMRSPFPKGFFADQNRRNAERLSGQ
jgi:predicted phage terminase large subunit-like protein